jgi:rhomboid family GlyGly-CTERM serine protease
MTIGSRRPRLAAGRPGWRTEAAALAGAALLLLLQALPAAAPLLEYRRALLAAEPWRGLTGHFVHLNWQHAAVNAAAWWVLALLFAPQLNARRQLVTVLLGAAFISLALALVYPSIEWYRGASGTMHALFFAGAAAALASAVGDGRRRAALLAAALLAGGAVKLALELPPGADTPYAAWLGAPTAPQAHLAGAIFGAALGLLYGARRRAPVSRRGGGG